MMLNIFFPVSKTVYTPMKNRFAPELTEHGKNRCEYNYFATAGSNAVVVITGGNSFHS